MKNQLKAIAVFLPAVSFLFVLAAFFFPDDPDLGYHLTIGSQILSTLSWPTVDQFRFASNAPEVAYSWLPDIFLAYSYQQAGATGLRIWVILSLLALVSTCILLLWDRLKISHCSLIIFIISISCLQFATPRPRIWSVVFLGLLLLALKLTRENNLNFIKRAGILACIIIVWANSHITVVLSPFIIFVYCFFEKLNRGITRAFYVAASFSSIAAIAVFINPYGYQLYKLGLVFSPAAQKEVAPLIIELGGFFRNFPSMPIWAWAGFIVMLLFLFLAINWFRLTFVKANAGLKVREQNLLHLGLILLACFFLLLTLESARHLPFFTLIVCALLGERIKHTVHLARAPVLMGLAVFTFAITVGLFNTDHASKWYDSRYSTSIYADQALTVAKPYISKIKPKADQHVILTQFGVGHFTTWWLYEHNLSQFAKLVIDGRSDETGLKRFFPVQEAFRGLCVEEVVAQFQVTVILVHVADALFEKLDSSENWVAIGGQDIVAFIDSSLLVGE